jgi:hypothetical protein
LPIPTLHRRIASEEKEPAKDECGARGSIAADAAAVIHSISYSIISLDVA